MASFFEIVGVAGVGEKEPRSAAIVQAIFQWVMVPVIFWLLTWEYLLAHHYVQQHVVDIMRWLVWSVFLAETLFVSVLCKRPWRYIITNWLNLFIICIAFPVFWVHGIAAGILRVFRVIIVLYLLLPLGKNYSRKPLSLTHLGAILLLFIIITITGGLFISYIDADVHGPLNGIWWAFQTITTVGYGDVLPQSLSGRIFAIFFMMIGVGLLATLSASFAYFLLQRKTMDAKVLEHLRGLEKNIAALQEDIKKK